MDIILLDIMIQKITDIWRDLVVWRTEQQESQDDEENLELSSSPSINKNANWTRVVALDQYDSLALQQWKIQSDSMDTKQFIS